MSGVTAESSFGAASGATSRATSGGGGLVSRGGAASGGPPPTSPPASILGGGATSGPASGASLPTPRAMKAMVPNDVPLPSVTEPVAIWGPTLLGSKVAVTTQV